MKLTKNQSQEEGKENHIHIHLSWLLPLIILFWGEPDLVDALIKFLMRSCGS